MNTTPNTYFDIVLYEYKRIKSYYIIRVQEDIGYYGHSYYATAPPSETAIKCYQCIMPVHLLS